MKIKIGWVFLSLGFISSSVYAAGISDTSMPVSNETNLIAPTQQGNWSFGVTAVFLQPTDKAFYYADLNTDTLTQTSPTDFVTSHEETHENVEPGYHWWFGADITYGFPGSGRDVTLAYEGFQGKDTDRVSADSTEEDIPNGTKVTYISDVGIFATIITAKGETETNYDAADLVFGQKLKVGERINLRPFIGMRYAYINIEDKGYYTGQNTPSAPETYQTNILKFDNTFNGIGPRFGSDAQINLGKGISVRGRLGLSALIGRPNIEQSSHYSRQDDISGTIFTYNNTTDVHTDTNTQIVPEIDGRLGLNYTHDFDSNFALGVEAGWQATSYISVFDDTPSDFTYDNGSGVPIVLHTSFDSNFGLQGPYARVQLDIA